MVSYCIQLREVRLASDGTDDVALFAVDRETDGKTWTVPALLSPLFRLVHMRAVPSQDRRREMAARSGARAIVEWMNQGGETRSGEAFLFSVDYPGAPGDPEPLLPYEQIAVQVEE